MSSSSSAAEGAGSGKPSSTSRPVTLHLCITLSLSAMGFPRVHRMRIVSSQGKEMDDGGDGGGRKEGEGDADFDLAGAAAGWVEARTSCPHLPAMPAAAADDLARVPPPDSPCSRCDVPFVICSFSSEMDGQYLSLV
uniref:Uncharacterized protein n=1 Tax=Oryza meridionalis TaxID=40149 RepID=A0A0E0FCF2_9ORYZ